MAQRAHHRPAPVTKVIGIRGPKALHTRLRVACAEEGMDAGTLLEYLLDLRDERKRRSKAAMKHPLDIGRVARVEEL